MFFYKLIAVDMDGTLLTNAKSIPTKTLEKINEIIKKGYIFCISTGRPYAGVKKYCEMINGDIPLILYNGALVKFSRSNNVLLSSVLTNNQSKKIINLINKYDGTYIFWSNEKLYVNKINDYSLNYFKISNVDAIIIENEDMIPHGEITKIIWFDENMNLVNYQKTVLKEFSDVNFFTSQPTFLEFVSKDISKAKALEVLGEYFKISKDEIIAIGDGCNDIAMLKYVGLGVAMGNSEQLVKDNAKYITLSNEEEGVLKVINEFIEN